MFSWANQNLVDSTIEFGYYTDNQIFAWANKTFLLIKFGWLYQLFWLIQPNTMVNLKKRFAQANNNFIAASNNNILLKKKEKKISGLSQRHIVPDWIWTCDLRVSYLPTYLS